MARFLVLVVLALIVTLVTTPAAAKSCTSAQVEEAFALPDGSVHPAGRLTLCFGSDHTPVRTLQRTFVDGRPVGIFASRRQVVEQPEESGYYLIFNRAPGNPMRLAGFAQPSSGRAEMFLLEQPARVEVEDSITTSRSRPPGPTLLLAAAPLR